MINRIALLGVIAVLGMTSAASADADASRKQGATKRADVAAPGDAEMIARGRYVIRIAGCNDCHTSGYAQAGGDVPEKKWLTGDAVGFSGPWGTSYPTNLRLFIPTMSEDDWVAFGRHLKTRPPMPWFALNHMSERDLRAVYRFVRFLGPAGKPAPSAIDPDTVPATAYIVFVPQLATKPAATQK